MVVVRRRLIFWLIKAYIKKSKKILILSFFAGLFIFFIFIFGARYLKTLFTLHRSPVIGIAGSYQKENLPPIIVDRLSRGLTQVEKDGSVKPDLATGFRITDNGKTYTFFLKQNLNFSDGSKFESKDISYNFSDVNLEKPDRYTLIFKLKSPYAPFLATVSKPIFKNGYIGVGNYFIENIQLNGNFIQAMTLGLTKNRFDSIKFIFYPTEVSLKTAFMLGEVTEVSDINSLDFNKSSFEKFPRITVKKSTDYSHLVTLFYDTTDSELSDKKLRLGLNYALPDNFRFGEKAFLPYPASSIYYNSDLNQQKQDLDHARLLLPQSKMQLTITTLRKYRQTAKDIAFAWSKIGIKTKVVEVDEIPDKFQIFLSDFNLPKDPDQYILWHSGQLNNIMKYKNLRIDKLLEDGRKTLDINERKKIYADFQKFLLEDMPASFLYFPYKYEVTRN